jgi:hypothetical protein
MTTRMRKVLLLGLVGLTIFLLACGGGAAATQMPAEATEIVATAATPLPEDTQTPKPTVTQLPPPAQVYSYFPASEIPQLMIWSLEQFWVEPDTELTNLTLDLESGHLVKNDMVTFAGESSHFYTGEILRTDEESYCMLAFDAEGNEPFLDEGYCGNPFDKIDGKSQPEIDKMCAVPDDYVSAGTLLRFTDSAGVVNTMKVYEDGLAAVEFSDDLEPMGAFPCTDITLVDYNMNSTSIYYGVREIYVPASILLATPTPPASIPDEPVLSG